MPKSEQIGELYDLELSSVNEKLRITQRLIDGILETFGEDFLLQFMTTAEHDILPHTLGQVVPHDSILNLTDVAVLNDTLTDNEDKILKVKRDATVVEAGTDTDIVDVNRYLTGTANQVIVTDDGDNTATLSTPQDIHTGASPTFAGLTTTAGRIQETTLIDDTDSPYTVLSTDHIIFCDTDGGVITVNLPAGVEGTHYKLINCGGSGNDLTVDPNGTEQLYGSGAGVASVLADGEVIDIHYNATKGWW